jgi:serine protease Do
MGQRFLTPFTLAFLCSLLQLLVAANTSFASSPPASVAEADEKMVGNCAFVGMVDGSSMLASYFGGRKKAMRSALKKASSKGATHIVWSNVGTDATGSSFATGKAYQCNPSAVAIQSPPVDQSPGTNTLSIPEKTLKPQDFYKVANETTVFIEGQDNGSGVIFARANNIYYVLTAKHVVLTNGQYIVATPNGKKYSVDYSQIKKLDKLDLAVIPFVSNGQTYPVARLGNSDQIKQGESVYVSGWPAPAQAITQRTHLITDGRIVGFQKGDTDGYELMYGNSTAPGMSGGPVFDSNGQVVGIHGRAAGNQVSGKVGINLGIPINLFLRLVPETGLSLQKLGLKTGM